MPERTLRTTLPTFHWFCYCLAYATICFLFSLLFASPMIFPWVAVVSIVIATIVLSAVCSAYGTGNVLARCAISIAMTYVVLLGVAFGLPRLYRASGLALLPAVPAICLATQAVHWLFRFCFGWQFVLKGNRPLPTKFTITELLFITMLVAISIVGVRAATSLFIYANPQLVTVQEFDPVEVDSGADQSEGEMQQAVKAAEQLVALQFGVCAAIFAVVSLLMTGPLLLASSPKDLPSGTKWFAGGAVGYVTIWISMYFGWSAMVNLLFVTFAMTCIAFAVPLIHTRALGVSLRLGKQSTQA